MEKPFWEKQGRSTLLHTLQLSGPSFLAQFLDTQIFCSCQFFQTLQLFLIYSQKHIIPHIPNTMHTLMMFDAWISVLANNYPKSNYFRFFTTTVTTTTTITTATNAQTTAITVPLLSFAAGVVASVVFSLVITSVPASVVTEPVSTSESRLYPSSVHLQAPRS